MKKSVIALVMFALSGPAMAQEADPAAPPPIPPPQAKSAADADADAEVPIPPKVQDERSQVAPTVDIRRDEDDNIIEEYRSEGRVYMVKITPKNGLPYYYLDDDGDGQLELAERDRAANPVRPVYWKVKEW